jgi:hypothetical protein
MSKEAMKLALEALLAHEYELRKVGQSFKVEPAIKALEEALAKQEQGEPVALETIYETIINWDEGGGKRSRRELARRIDALYTTPQPKQEQGEPVAQTLRDAVFTVLEGFTLDSDVRKILESAYYTTLQQRTWVGLDPEEIRKTNHHMVDGAYHYSFKQGAEWAEAKLKEKNT